MQKSVPVHMLNFNKACTTQPLIRTFFECLIKVDLFREKYFFVEKLPILHIERYNN